MSAATSVKIGLGLLGVAILALLAQRLGLPITGVAFAVSVAVDTES